MRTRLLTITTALALTACSGGTSTPTVTTTPAASPPGPMKIADPYSPTIEPSAFTTKVDNPYFPLMPGTRTLYEAATQDGLQRTTTEVTRDTKKVMGVDTVVVHDTVSIDNEPVEDTLDWYAQDRDGNVWYFGEATKELKDGAENTAGSFEGGVNGALPGVIMPAHPRVGDQYRQEFAKGIAEDAGEVLSLTGSETTPLTGPANDLLVTKDSDLLNPAGPGENKYYARGVGLILTVQTTGAPERDQATVVEKF